MACQPVTGTSSTELKCRHLVYLSEVRGDSRHPRDPSRRVHSRSLFYPATEMAFDTGVIVTAGRHVGWMITTFQVTRDSVTQQAWNVAGPLLRSVSFRTVPGPAQRDWSHYATTEMLVSGWASPQLCPFKNCLSYPDPWLMVVNFRVHLSSPTKTLWRL